MLNESEARRNSHEPQPNTTVTCFHHDKGGTITPMEAYKRYFDDKKCQHCNLRCVDLVGNRI